MGATERAKRINWYLTSEKKYDYIRERYNGKERETTWALIETESAKIRDRKGKT